jgi:hypothetical protein
MEFPELFEDLDVPEKARRRLSASKKRQKAPITMGSKSNTLMSKLEEQEANSAISRKVRHFFTIKQYGLKSVAQ